MSPRPPYITTEVCIYVVREMKVDSLSMCMHPGKNRYISAVTSSIGKFTATRFVNVNVIYVTWTLLNMRSTRIDTALCGHGYDTWIGSF